MATLTVPYTGVWPALLTPLDANLDINIPAFAAHARRLLAAGCTGVTPFGTTGEGPSFSAAERIAALEGLVAGGVPAGRILVSTSCAALPDVVTLTRHAVQAGAMGVLLLPPFFLKGVPDSGVIDFYEQVIAKVANTQLRIVLYHIPQISGVALSHQVVQTLVQRHPQTIIGIKDSGGQRDVSLAFAKAFMPPLQVWVGHEPDLQTLAAQGALGAVSGVGNVMPRLLQRLVAKADGPNAVRDQERDPNRDQARDQARVEAFIKILVDGWGMTAAFKGIMAILNNDPDWRYVRAPLVALTQAQMARLTRQLADFALDTSRD